MLTNSSEQLLNFISHNHLKKDDGIICFDASIRFYTPISIDLISEVQIITLPEEHALYILNYPDTAPVDGDVYSTGKFNFVYPGNGLLDISGANGERIVVISITIK